MQVPAMSEGARKTAEQYRGTAAKGYEARRKDTAKWDAENRVVESWLGQFPPGLAVLDCPCGTGRFFDLLIGKGFRVIARDLNQDMLDEAKQKPSWPKVEAGIGNIFALDLADNSVDVALAIRMMNRRFTEDDMIRAMGELQRVARKAVILNLRVWTPGTKYRHAQKAETLHRALQPGWKIARNERIHEDDFRMFMLCAG